MPFFKTLVRVGLIGGIALGATAVVAHNNPRVGMLLKQAGSTVTSSIDSLVDDPIALRHQLAELQREYPERIAAVQGDLSELSNEIVAIERDRDISHRTVQLAQGQLEQLEPLLRDAQEARSDAPSAVIRVRFDNSSLPLDQAFTRAAQLKSTANAYTTRALEATQSLEVLSQQSERLADLLAQLETEYAEFQAQIAQLDSQIAAIERNERLIDMVEERENAIRKYDKFETISLQQVTSRMAKIRGEQEARLRSLTDSQNARSLEEQATEMIDRERAAQDLFKQASKPVNLTPPTIEIGPAMDSGSDDEPSQEPVALNEPIIIQ